ncbi:hypothetical protein [Dyadobacter sandarakinus]|uniref:Uncharacterized protein n=1 Tax=Dyadobacter sandarakinus TaxID=2747268 RepID=A0ABX7I494_9BACT|nr:hypothetical protein [Dyadobacter sandarakinus]QRR00048.1 hypothetical protein HWI92_03530 [Dyadobacter sandarakinus]
MDIRTTLAVNETFMEMLRDCRNRGVKGEMILDINGLVRAEGQIQEIYTDATNSYLTLQDGTKIEVKTIIAMNGIFLPEYAEC